MFSITIITNFIHFLLFDFLCKSVFDMDSNKHHTRLIIGLVLLKSISSAFQNQYINLLFSFSFYFVYITVNKKSKINWMYNNFWIIIFIGITSLSETLAVLIMKLITGMTISEIVSNISYLLFANIIGIMCKIIMIYIICGIYKMKSYVPRKHEYLLLVMLPSSLILIVLSVDPVIRHTNRNIFFAFSMIYNLISILCSIYAINHMLKQEIENNKLELANVQNNMNQVYYEQVNKKMNEVRAIKHDMLKHYKIIYSFLSTHKYEDAHEYINWLSPQLDMPKLSYTNNSMLDTVINMYLNDINNSSIIFKSDVCKVDLSWLNPVDLTVILGNIFENAICSCNRSKEKKIYFIVSYNGGYITFKVVNSCDNIMKNGNKFISSNRIDHKPYGLSNITKCAQKYNAESTFKYDSERNEFHSTIIFPRRELI